MAEHTPKMIRDHVDAYRPKMRNGVLHDYVKECREMLGAYAERLATDEAEDAADVVVVGSRSAEIAAEVSLVAQLELDTLRGFVETIASMFKGKMLGDEACRALGREPERKAG